MKLAITLIALTFAISIFPSQRPSQDTSMNAFWDKFKAAVVKGDKQGVFALSALPVTMEYSMPKIRTKAQFMKNYKHIFAGEANAAKCFQSAKPEINPTNKNLFSVGCPFAENGAGDEPLVYTFKLTRAGWRFVGYDNINE